MKLYNTLTRKTEPLAPLKRKSVSIYVCGPTVYDVPHIGHARSAFVFDVLRRYLESAGFSVRFVRNVTDVDDKIIEKAKQETGSGDLNAACREVAEKYLKAYHETMDRLGITRPSEEPRATDHVVPEMTDLIAKLLTQGAAYEAESGDIYFSVRNFEGYGRLSNRALDELKTGARVEPGEGKRDPLDFALWKAAKPGEPSWKSPWGKGRPGWHIECSAMSTKLLGDAFDIHGGGVDLVFPHHENEIAQARAAGKPFAKVWVHNGLLTVGGEKMSKSLGNWTTVEKVLEVYPHPDYLKILFLKIHYRSPLDYSSQRMEEAKTNWREFARFFQHYDQVTDGSASSTAVKEVKEARQRFASAIEEDLNTPVALAVLFDLVNLGHRELESGKDWKRSSITSIFNALIECGGILGLFHGGLSEESSEKRASIEEKIQERDAARKRKDFKKADAIRNELETEGFLLTDTASATLWRRRIR